MPAIVSFPQIVQLALEEFGDLFANEAQRVHFAEYLTGLFVAAQKTVCGINREFAQTTDQSCLNRFVHHDAWDVEALNRRRLAVLQRDPELRYSDYGTIAPRNPWPPGDCRGPASGSRVRCRPASSAGCSSRCG